MMKLKNAPYYRIWHCRYKPFSGGNWYLAMHFSPQYFEKLKRELESAEYELTVKNDVWYSPPVGYFFVSNALQGESFVFIDWGSYTFKKV